MLTNIKNQVYSINFNDDKTKTKLDLELRLKQPQDCNFILSLNLDYELFIKEFDKKILINSNFLTDYNSNDNTVKVLNLKINYVPIVNENSNDNFVDNVKENDVKDTSSEYFIDDNENVDVDTSEYFVEVETEDDENNSNIEFFIDSENDDDNALYNENDDDNVVYNENDDILKQNDDILKQNGDIKQNDDILNKYDDNNNSVYNENDILKRNDDSNVVYNENYYDIDDIKQNDDMKENDDDIVKDEKYYEDRIKAILNKQQKYKYYERSIDLGNLENVNSSHNISRDSLSISSNNSSDDGKNNVVYKIINKQQNIDSINHIPKIEDKLVEFLNDKPRVAIDPKETKSNVDIYNKMYCHLELLTCSSSRTSLIPNILYIIADLMKFIDNFSIEGEEKKKILVDTLSKFLKDKKFSDNDINYIITNICPGFIDILILVEKRKVIIRKKSNCFFPWICS